MYIHRDHHKYIKQNETGWHWNNLFLINDTFLSTIDLWLTEVIPTVIICALTGQWWILILYYVWAAFFQENFEHNVNNDFYPFTAGKWHMMHHKNHNNNFGLFIPIWDKLYRTENIHYK
jgi:sterol desaturase/sphingolipid hydroxylase (fatty acid hydroxylase superfamily)